jgi:hypothetical protein
MDESGFLKCAFASPDFVKTGFQGIPDDFNGSVFSVHSDSIFTETIAAGTTAYYIIAPSPGIAYYKSTTINGNFTPVYYPEKDQLFAGAESDDTNVSQFRYASLWGEITNTTPMLNIGGTLVVQDAPLKLARSLNAADTVQIVVNGMPDTVQQNVYADNARNGCYTVATNQEHDFEWTEPILGNDEQNYIIPLGSGGAHLYNPGVDGYVTRGWDNSFGSKLIVISAPAGNAQTIFLRAGCCVEYRPKPDTLLAQIAHDSPPQNKAEMALYHQLAHELPIAVPRKDNGSFWNFIKGAARSISGVLSHVPGPIGQIAGGVNQIIS